MPALVSAPSLPCQAPVTEVLETLIHPSPDIADEHIQMRRGTGASGRRLTVRERELVKAAAAGFTKAPRNSAGPILVSGQIVTLPPRAAKAPAISKAPTAARLQPAARVPGVGKVPTAAKAAPRPQTRARPAPKAESPKDTQRVRAWDFAGTEAKVEAPAVAKAPAAAVAKAKPKAKPAAPITLTPITLRIEALILRLAQSRQPMATNVTLSEVLHGPGRETVRRSIDRLVLAKRISIEIKPGMRRIRVVGTKHITDWGAFVTTGHAPYSRHAKGTAPPAKTERPDYKPEANQPFRYRINPQRLVETKPAETCTWGDSHCHDATVPGFSYCFEHGRKIYASWDKKPPRRRP